MKVALDEAPRCVDIMASRKPKLGGKGRSDFERSFLVLSFVSLFAFIYILAFVFVFVILYMV